MDINRGYNHRSEIRRGKACSPEGVSKNITKKIQNYYFNLNDILGKGSFSTVYRGIEEKTEEVVAVKVIELNKIESPTLKELLYSEIQILKSIRHPNILQCYEVFFSANNCYIITQYCNQGDVKSLLAQNGPLNERSASKIVLGVFQGLRYLSKQHIIHRDLKTANVFMKNGKPKIADFGFAKRIRQPFKDINIGSPVCMSPQGIIHNIYGPKTDVWAFGIFLYQLFHGVNVFHFCKSEQQLKQAVVKQLRVEKLYQGLNLELKQLIIKCLNINPQTRVTIEDLQFDSQIRKLQQSNKISNIQVSQVEQFMGNTYDSKVSTEVPLPNDKRNYVMKKNLMLDDSSSMIKNESHKTDRQLHNKFNSFDVKVNSPKQNYRNIRKNIGYQGQIRSRDYKTPMENTSRQSQLNTQYGQSKQTQRNSMNLSDRRFTPMSLKKDPKNLTTIINYKSAGTFQPSKGNQKQKVDKTTSIAIDSLQFEDLLALLHYCRVIYKTIKIVTKMPFEIQYLTSWLFFMLSKIRNGIPSEQSNQIKKFKQILSDYTLKYKRQLYLQKHVQPSLQKMQYVLSEIKNQLEKFPGKDESTLVFVKFLYDINCLLNRAMSQGNYKEFTQRSKAQQFLTNNNEQPGNKRKALSKF